MESESASTRAFEAVVRYFEQDGWKFTCHDDRQLLTMGLVGKNGRYQCLVRVRNEHPVVSVLSIAGLRVPEDKLASMAEFLTRANYGLCLGNFEMDYSDGEVRYKTSLNIRDGELTTEMIKVLVHVNFGTMDRYFPGMMVVLSGSGSPESAVARVEETSPGTALPVAAVSTHERLLRRGDGRRPRLPWLSN
jgi:hypothetical protein